MNSELETRRFSITRMIAVVLIPTMVFYSTACSLVSPKTQKLTVSSTPEGANVTINGERVGVTPLETKINRRDTATIMISKDGYHAVTEETGRGLSGIGIVDVVFGCLWLVPLLGLIGDGAYKQGPKNVAVIMAENK